MKDCMNCLWHDQCGELCGEGCEDFSPIDDDVPAFAYYESILAENAAEYRLMTAEYGDGREEDFYG